MKNSAENNKFIFVTGFFGAPVKEIAEKIAAEKHARLISLDDEIEKADGRSVLRICMIMGEHEYRNKEYEMLQKLTADAGETRTDSDVSVVVCSDGVLLDDMSAEIIKNHDLVIVGRDMSCDELWKNAESVSGSCHAFMTLPDMAARHTAFNELYERQTQLFQRF